MATPPASDNDSEARQRLPMTAFPTLDHDTASEDPYFDPRTARLAARDPRIASVDRAAHGRGPDESEASERAVVTPPASLLARLANSDDVDPYFDLLKPRTAADTARDGTSDAGAAIELSALRQDTATTIKGAATASEDSYFDPLKPRNTLPMGGHANLKRGGSSETGQRLGAAMKASGLGQDNTVEEDDSYFDLLRPRNTLDGSGRGKGSGEDVVERQGSIELSAMGQEHADTLKAETLNVPAAASTGDVARNAPLDTNGLRSSAVDSEAAWDEDSEDIYVDSNAARQSLLSSSESTSRSGASRLSLHANPHYSHTRGRREQQKQSRGSRHPYTHLESTQEPLAALNTRISTNPSIHSAQQVERRSAPPGHLRRAPGTVPSLTAGGKGGRKPSPPRPRSRRLWWVTAGIVLALVAALAVVGLVTTRSADVSSATHAASAANAQLAMRMGQLEDLVAEAVFNVTSRAAQAASLKAEATALSEQLKTTLAETTALQTQLELWVAQAAAAEAAAVTAQENTARTEATLNATLRATNLSTIATTRVIEAAEASANGATGAVQNVTAALPQLAMLLNTTAAAVASVASKNAVTEPQLDKATASSRAAAALLEKLDAQCGPQVADDSVWRKMLRVAADGNVVCKVVPTPAKLANTAGAGFGRTVAADRDGLLAVGGEYNTTAGKHSGAVYVYFANATGARPHLVTRLVPADGGADGWSALSIAVSRDLVVVGARAADAKGIVSGCVYVFQVNTTRTPQHVLLGKLVPDDDKPDSYFGAHVAVDADGLIVVTAPGNNTTAAPAGSAYVYYANRSRADGAPPTLVTKLVPQDGAVGDHFGSKVAIGGNGLMAVAAWQNPGGGPELESVYAYRINVTSSTPQQLLGKLLPVAGAAGELYGSSVAVSRDGGLIVVGAAGQTESNSSHSGSAYLYRVNTTDAVPPRLVGTLLPDDAGAAGCCFGSSVAAGGPDLVVVGEYDHTSSAPGAVYVYRLNDTMPPHLLATLVPDDGGALSMTSAFGAAVAAGGDALVVVGAYTEDSAYVFQQLHIQ